MISTNDLRNGITIEVDNAIYVVLESQHVKPGKGPAFVRTKLKNLRTGAILDKTFNAGIKIPTARIEKESMQYLYEMNDTYYFMNVKTYEQLELSKENIQEAANYLIPNLEVTVTTFEKEIIGVELPDKVTFEVIKTEPAVKGNTATNALKDAYVETGLLVKVPLFIEQGEKIIVSTSDGKYTSRA